jgi:Fe-S-cluster containining protein
VYASSQEAALIMERIAQQPVAEQERIRGAVKAWYERFAGAAVSRQPEPHVVAYRRLELLCPLLKDERCSVYEDRPIGCRSHIARSDVTLCQETDRRVEQKFLMTHQILGPALRLTLKDPAWTRFDHLGVLLYGEMFPEVGRPASSAGLEVRVQA